MEIITGTGIDSKTHHVSCTEALCSLAEIIAEEGVKPAMLKYERKLDHCYIWITSTEGHPIEIGRLAGNPEALPNTYADVSRLHCADLDTKLLPEEELLKYTPFTVKDGALQIPNYATEHPVSRVLRTVFEAVGAPDTTRAILYSNGPVSPWSGAIIQDKYLPNRKGVICTGYAMHRGIVIKFEIIS